ncbi:hypothetical protein X777_16879 [Ooceraea biroi]|uniref:Uncharacterized protein n=1 Tax=Ooceraea biroi TaxID=2015173 RepID=A0A026WS94_OOCBI|nr:hypothetical protein X777_16879 [Ooceraea biroi]
MIQYAIFRSEKISHVEAFDFSNAGIVGSARGYYINSARRTVEPRSRSVRNPGKSHATSTAHLRASLINA